MSFKNEQEIKNGKRLGDFGTQIAGYLSAQNAQPDEGNHPRFGDGSV